MKPDLDLMRAERHDPNARNCASSQASACRAGTESGNREDMVEIRSIISVVSNFLSPRLHTVAIVLLACVVGGELHADDDLEAVAWFPLAGPLSEMAFEADAHICERYYRTHLLGAPVDPGYAKSRARCL
jgi:hypothetical protein